jgi:hypothetical protein
MRKSKSKVSKLSFLLVVSLTSFVGGYSLKKEVVKKEYATVYVPKNMDITNKISPGELGYYEHLVKTK